MPGMDTFDSPWDDPHCITWSFPIFGNPLGLAEDAPSAWVDACIAIARDLSCERHGREAVLDGLHWVIQMDSEYRISFGWKLGRGYAGDVDSFLIGHGMMENAPAAPVMVWCAERVQDELAGYEFVQWPRRHGHLLLPALSMGKAVWFDKSVEVSPIGMLCE